MIGLITDIHTFMRKYEWVGTYTDAMQWHASGKNHLYSYVCAGCALRAPVDMLHSNAVTVASSK